MDSTPVLRVAGLTYAYPKGPTALDALRFEVKFGESVGIVGPNGAGKTTLFLCLAGVLAAPEGTISIVGLDPTDRNQRRQLPAKVGIVFQNSDDQLFNSTVLDDVAFGPLNMGMPQDEVRERASSAMASMNLTGLEDRVPFHLSSGEKRRAALAGVLALRPEVLLLDEPSAHLDPRGRRELIKLINGLPVTKLLASHDLELVLATCSRVLVLDAGRRMADGPVQDILADKSLMEASGLEVPHSLTYHHEPHQHG
jgi:cobalt/nickel transport system ATP-binding protein